MGNHLAWLQFAIHTLGCLIACIGLWLSGGSTVGYLLAGVGLMIAIGARFIPDRRT